MKHNPKKYLADMFDACQYLIEATQERTIQDYDTDRAFRGSVERELQNIGEALRQLDSRFPEIAARIPEHQRIIRFRHVLVHGYDSLKPQLVWDVIERNLPRLCDELEILLKE
jgi:uncharacterized protein with HEPN domain